MIDTTTHSIEGRKIVAGSGAMPGGAIMVGRTVG
ncbi:hypothetical protein FIU85_00800 [Roseovarius sp. THAF8]|nr:hypothetical protein FIU85_00800 [Roseovarius sp. THAF8]